MVLYFTATGNSLYAAKQFDMELVSIPQELKKADRHYKADSIGVICPLYELDMPDVIKEFIKNSEFETDYFYIVITYGCHHGGVAERVQAYLETIGKKADYINTVIMHDNALPVFDMEEQKRLDPDKQVDEHLAGDSVCLPGGKGLLSGLCQHDKGARAYAGKALLPGDGGLHRLRDMLTGVSYGVHICGGQQGRTRLYRLRKLHGLHPRLPTEVHTVRHV